MNFISLVERKLTPKGVMNKDHIYACPLCEDEATGHHLYVNYDKNYWHCFKCDAGGKRIEALLKALDIDVSYDYDKLYQEPDTRLDDILGMKSKKKIKKKEVVDYSTDLAVLTEYFLAHSKPLSNEAYNYLISRGLTPYMIDRLIIMEGISRYGEELEIRGNKIVGRDYSGRIMVPSLRKDGLISFYVARDYIGDKKSKYLNPPKELAAASEDVWNLAMVDSNSVIICEGVFTAMFASPALLNAVATYGKSIAENIITDSGVIVSSQGEKLLAKKFKNYYVAYDADARKEAIKSCQYLYDRGANVYLVLIDPKVYGPKADIADIGHSEFMKLMRNAIHYTGELSIIDK